MNYQRFAAALLMLALHFSSPNCRAGLLLLPEKITLDGPAAEQRLVVENADAGEALRELAMVGLDRVAMTIPTSVIAAAAAGGTALGEILLYLPNAESCKVEDARSKQSVCTGV